MNGDVIDIHHEINRYVLLLRLEDDVEKKHHYLDEIVRLNLELHSIITNKPLKTK